MAGGVVRVADQREAKVQAAQGQPDLIGGAGMNASKGRHVVAAYRDELSFFNDRAVRQCHRLAALLNGKATFYAEKAKQVDVEVASGLDDLAVGAGHGQRQGLPGTAGGHSQAGLALGHAAGFQGVVDDLVIELASLVDADLQGRALQGQAVNAHKGHGIGRGLQAGPGAAGVGLAAEQRKGKVCIRELQANAIRAAAVDADKGRHVAAAHGEGIDLHHLAAGQGDALARFFQ